MYMRISATSSRAIAEAATSRSCSMSVSWFSMLSSSSLRQIASSTRLSDATIWESASMERMRSVRLIAVCATACSVESSTSDSTRL